MKFNIVENTYKHNMLHCTPHSSKQQAAFKFNCWEENQIEYINTKQKLHFNKRDKQILF